MGGMTFGAPGADGARVSNVQDIEAILDVFLKHGHRELDTARVWYCYGTSEATLGKIDWQAKGILMETKHYPYPGYPQAGSHSAENLREYLKMSLEALNTDVPYEEALKAVDEIYKRAISSASGSATTCRSGHLQATWIYSAYCVSSLEPEVFPALRTFGIAFYEFSSLAGGFFTDRYISADAGKGSGFDPEQLQGEIRIMYFKPEKFAALDTVWPVAAAHGLTMAEVALRWISHHSLMRQPRRPGEGALPDEVVVALDKAWEMLKPAADKYFH
ncbi:Aldo/keto reductase [Mycena vitilis]|nr:Aldo/keto reductase [Mycena vitilis]